MAGDFASTADTIRGFTAFWLLLMYRRHIIVRMRWLGRRARRFVMHSVLHADDPPHRLALGAAIGVAVAFTPTVGFQMALIVLVSWLLGANRLVGVPLAWISNPATMVPIFYVCYQVGVAMTGYGGVDGRWWAELARPPGGWWESVSFYWSRLVEIALPLWAGSLLVALVAGAATYIAVDRAIRAYRIRRWGRLVPPSTHPVIPPPTRTIHHPTPRHAPPREASRS